MYKKAVNKHRSVKPASHWGYRIVAVVIFAKFRTPWKLRGISGQPGEIPINNRGGSCKQILPAAQFLNSSKILIFATPDWVQHYYGDLPI